MVRTPKSARRRARIGINIRFVVKNTDTEVTRATSMTIRDILRRRDFLRGIGFISRFKRNKGVVAGQCFDSFGL